MRFQNYTPFPAIAWKSADNHNNRYISYVVRVKYAFDTVDSEGHWTLKLHTDQEALFGKDIYYNEEDIFNSSVRFESDYVSYKPHADLIVNAYAHASTPLTEWRCGVKVLRPVEFKDEPYTPLLEKWIRVKGERFIQQDVLGASFTKSKKENKIPLRYEYANGGSVSNPYYDPAHPKEEKPFLMYAQYNPVGVGVVHKSMFEQNLPLRAPQIEAMSESLDKPNMSNAPQGFGFIGRSWKPRIDLAGTFDDAWIKKKHPVMPDDFKEAYNNAAHPDLQLKGYFLSHDKIVLHNLVKDRYVQSFELPNFYFKAQQEEEFSSSPHFLNIDTVIVDILEDEMKKNAVYVSYRTRIPADDKVQQSSVNMFVPDDFLGVSHG